MRTRMMCARGGGLRWAAVGIGSLLAATGLTSRASADHGLLEQVSTGPTGGNGSFEASFAGASGRRITGLVLDPGAAGERRHRHVVRCV